MKTKVFGLGLGKTGTTTLGAALAVLGYRHLGWRRGLTPQYYEQGLDAIMPYTKEYDSFEDFPWPLVYKELDGLFPDAKFVLTKRKDVEVWYKSLKTHRDRNLHLNETRLVFGYDHPEEAPQFHKDYYERHNVDVADYFASRPDKLLTICWEEGHGWDELCAFLGEPLPDSAFPHANQTPGVWSRILKSARGNIPGYDRAAQIIKSLNTADRRKAG